MHNKDKSWSDDLCRCAFGLKQQAHIWCTCDHPQVNWEVLDHCQVRSNETCSQAKSPFIVRNKDVLMNAQTPYKWWSTLQSAVFFGSCLSLPPRICRGSGLECESVGKADLLVSYYNFFKKRFGGRLGESD